MKKGISLLTLVTTICVALLLCTIVINTVLNTDSLGKAEEAKFKTDLKAYDEEIKTSMGRAYIDDKDIINKTIFDLNEISKYSQTIAKSEYRNMVFINEGELTLYGSRITDEQRLWATEAKIKISDDIAYSDTVIISIKQNEWTNGNVIVEFSYPDIPISYVIQYMTNEDTEWNTGNKVIISQNTTVIARLYSETYDDEKAVNSTNITKIDKNPPNRPSLVSVTTEDGKVKILASGSTDDFSGIKGYVYSIDNVRWSDIKEEGEEYVLSMNVEPNFKAYAKAVDMAENYSTIASNGSAEVSSELVNITPGTNTWVKDQVTVNLSYSGTIPDGYEIEYKVGTAPWRSGITGVVTENALVCARLYKKNTQDEIAFNSVQISNIDKISPTIPNDVTITRNSNHIEALANGSMDYESGIEGYIYSIDGINWSQVLDNSTKYVVNIHEDIKLYVKSVDRVGNQSTEVKIVPIKVI